MLNKVIIIGRLTHVPEVRKTSSGKSVMTVCVALNRSYESSDGQKADYPPVILWDKNAENTAKYCTKGSLVAVDGHIRTRKIEKENIYITEIVADKIIFLDNRKKNSAENVTQESSEPNEDDITAMMDSLAAQIPE